MRNTLVRMLAALMCTLAALADVVPVQDFDLQRMAGKWYLVGMATNAPWFVRHKATMKMGTAVVVATDGGDMDLTYAHLNDDGTCWRATHLAQKTDTPGRFTFHSQVWNNDNDMSIVDVLYDSFALVHVIKTKDGVSNIETKLYSRSPEASAAIQQKFTDLSLGSGILAENIVILPKADECPEA
ncbi:lipocalin-like [Dunckerocampus dactyliophorus]|uniref:lipocalin-like n=1 Tax=Dunckerocampus dactyliophorus TaxID=161453 RepID=UPI0024051DE5|nr:lipocalin-like [Dunckerocampus dactyliophorus]